MHRFLHGTAQFWRGGTLVAALVLGGFLGYAYMQPEVYESDALVELTNERAAEGSVTNAETMRAAVFDPRTLEQLALDTAPHVQQHDGDKAGSSVVDRTRRSIDLRPTGDARFVLAYRAPSAALAHRGCEALINAVTQRLAALRPPSSLSPQEDARQRARLVEERTRELASFVAQHPELAGKKSESGEAFLGVPGMRPPSTPAPAPTADTVLPILQQQKSRLEERIAYVEKVELGGAEDTDKLAPGDSLAKMDRASLQKMLVQVKAAIAARQAAAERARAAAPNENPPEGAASTAEGAASNPVQTEWQRLVQAVVEAQQQAAQGRETVTAGLHVVRAPNTPFSPVLPNRRLLAVLGAAAGLWAGLLWAFARVLLGHVRVTTTTQYLPEGLPTFPLEGEPAAAELPVTPKEMTSSPRLAAAKSAAPAVPALPNVPPSTPSIPKVPATPAPPKVGAATTPAPPTALATPSIPKVPATPTPPKVAVATPAGAPATALEPSAAKAEALPSFPMEADSAEAVDEATSGSRTATKPVPAPPVAAKSVITPLPAAPSVAAPPAPAVEPVAAEVPARGALPSFPMDAELAKAVDEATAAARAAPLRPASDPPNLPKVIIAPEAAIPPEPKASGLPSFPIEGEPAAAEAAKGAPSAAIAAPAAASAAPAAASAAPATSPEPAISNAPISPSAGAAPPVERAAASAPKGLPVLAVEGAREPAAPAKQEPAEIRPPERSPYAAVAEAARISSVPPPPEPAPAPKVAAEARRPSRHPSWYSESSGHGAMRAVHAPSRRPPAEEESIKPQPIAAVDAAKIEASPIMGIEEGIATAASGKQGISVYPPPVAPNVPDGASPGATMRMGSVSPGDPPGGGYGAPHVGRRVTQTLGSPLGASPSNAPTFGWTPHAGFGAHHVPPRESDPPPGLASIPPAPKPPTHVGPIPAPISPMGSSKPASPAVQSHPLTPGRHVAAVHPAASITVEAPTTALAVARPYESRSRSEPPAASSVVCDVPKGWAPHPSLIDGETSEELASLRDQLFRLSADECFVVGVSSGPEMAAYKSGLAARLAWTLAQPGHARVLLMEGDFDHPVVHRLMRIDMPIAAGFSEQMRRRMNGSSPTPWTIMRCAPNLYVLAEGLVRSPGLLPTVHFADSVNELRRAYDLIVIDGPAGGMSVDTRAIDAVTDGIVLAGETDLLERAASWFGKKQLMAVVSAGQTSPPYSR